MCKTVKTPVSILHTKNAVDVIVFFALFQILAWYYVIGIFIRFDDCYCFIYIKIQFKTILHNCVCICARERSTDWVKQVTYNIKLFSFFPLSLSHFDFSFRRDLIKYLLLCIRSVWMDHFMSHCLYYKVHFRATSILSSSTSVENPLFVCYALYIVVHLFFFYFLISYYFKVIELIWFTWQHVSGGINGNGQALFLLWGRSISVRYDGDESYIGIIHVT